jgi:pSer/pThr/pTyr-binding forkhead associated (FHA) protein
MTYRLRYQQHDFELSDGQFVIGRGADCQLALDDGLVSRRHARVVVDGDDVVIEDLGSRNGVKVNGGRIERPTPLGDGDRIQIGNQEMAILRVRAIAATTMAQPAPTLRADAFGLLGGLADKALAMGRGPEAERILVTHLQNVLSDARDGKAPAGQTTEQAARYAVKLAGATAKGQWVNYVFDLYTALRQSCPAEVVDELYGVVRKVDGVNVKTLRAYLEILRELARGPAERFVLNRVEGLDRLIALK